MCSSKQHNTQVHSEVEYLKIFSIQIFFLSMIILMVYHNIWDSFRKWTGDIKTIKKVHMNMCLI